MGQFLRDQKITSVVIDETTLDRLNEIVETRVALHNVDFPNEDHRAILFYVVRFDEKGYRFVNFNDVKKCFREARDVERVIFTVDSVQHRNSAGMFGVHCDLRFDRKEDNNCWVSITADNKDWVDVTFVNISEVLLDHKTITRFVNTPWTGLLIQLIGVLIGFVLSLWAATKIAPFLEIDNAFVIALFFSLLIYSNVWGYINAQIARTVQFSFPNIRFKRPGKDWVHLTVQGLVGGLSVTFAAFLLNHISAFVGSVISSFIK